MERGKINKKFDSYRLLNLFEYEASAVQNAALKAIHVRGSSDKEEIDNNEKLVVFMLHQNQLYSWI